jgi:hypothetical protein
MSEFSLHPKDQWWWDIPKLVQKTGELYQKLESKGRSSSLDAVVQKMIPVRKWERTKSLIVPSLTEACRTIRCFYVPKGYACGPAFAFPEYDIDGIPKRAQLKPLHDRFGPGKYMTIGEKEGMIGPVWIGNDPETIEAIVRTGTVLNVEGPFDLVGVRVAAPKLPSLSSTTKKLGKKHIAYLKMLGVERIIQMYDNETSGVGADAMWHTQRELEGEIEVIALECPAKDPSDALKSVAKFERLRNILSPYCGSETGLVLEEEDDED